MPEVSGEDMAKYQALECCDWCLGVRLQQEIKEPPEWSGLPTFLPKPTITKSYREGTVGADILHRVQEGNVVVFT
jgi:hypothetical protein